MIITLYKYANIKHTIRMNSDIIDGSTNDLLSDIVWRLFSDGSRDLTITTPISDWLTAYIGGSYSRYHEDLEKLDLWDDGADDPNDLLSSLISTYGRGNIPRYDEVDWIEESDGSYSFERN